MDSNAQAYAPHGRSNWIPAAEEFWSDTGRTLYDSQTSAPVARTICPPSMSSAAASPARTFPTPASELVLRASVPACGANTPASLASYDRASSSWRTSQLCLDGDFQEFWETWPRSGMTRNGRAYALPTLAPRTDENESGYWPTPAGIAGDGHSSELGQAAKYRTELGGKVRVWPTPTAEDSQCKGNHPGAVDSLHAAVKLFPTPTVGSATQGEWDYKPKRSQSLTGAARGQMWPTPTADDANNVTRASGTYQSLTREIWRTPQSRDWKGQTSEKWANRPTGDQTPGLPDQVGGQLNPTWVEWLMGYPLGWTALKDSATPSSRRSRNGSAKKS